MDPRTGFRTAPPCPGRAGRWRPWSRCRKPGRPCPRSGKLPRRRCLRRRTHRRRSCSRDLCPGSAAIAAASPLPTGSGARPHGWHRERRSSPGSRSCRSGRVFRRGGPPGYARSPHSATSRRARSAHRWRTRRRCRSRSARRTAIRPPRPGTGTSGPRTANARCCPSRRRSPSALQSGRRGDNSSRPARQNCRERSVRLPM